MIDLKSSLNLGAKRNSYYDSTDSDSSSSEDEEDDTQENKLKKGKVLKASYLSKKVGLFATNLSHIAIISYIFLFWELKCVFLSLEKYS